MSYCTFADLRKHALTTRKETGFTRLIISRSGVQAPPAPHHAYGVPLAAICSGPLGPAALGPGALGSGPLGPAALGPGALGSACGFGRPAARMK